ncbi:hypothetical protein QZM38_35190, partial [Burkholderia orbicola]|nr:hypothetical protein [Burkholderia orbicola]
DWLPARLEERDDAVRTALPGTIQHWSLNLNPPHTRNSGYLPAHARSERRGHHSTIAAHMPPNHRAATTEWNPQRLLKWAASIGPRTAAVVEHLLGGRQHPEC